MSEAVRLPNYLAYGVLLLSLGPLFALEANPSVASGSDFYFFLKAYFGYLLLFQTLLFGFVFAKSITQYDRISLNHRPLMILLNLVFGFTIIALFISWYGFFNAGLHVFEWLNQ